MEKHLKDYSFFLSKILKENEEKLLSHEVAIYNNLDLKDFDIIKVKNLCYDYFTISRNIRFLKKKINDINEFI